MRHRGSPLPLIIVGALVGLSFWLQSVSEVPAGDRSGRGRHDPDFIVENFTLRRFDTAGELQHTLVSQRMEHFPDDDSTHVDKPQVTFHSTPPMRLSADTARLSKDAKEVRLEGNVRLVRSGGKDATGMDTVVATSMLDVFPDEERARSDAPVTITQGRSIVNGTGLTADNRVKIITLGGPVRGTIERKPGTTP
jgi:lipopolysaccharide export system protein LptC